VLDRKIKPHPQTHKGASRTGDFLHLGARTTPLAVSRDSCVQKHIRIRRHCVKAKTRHPSRATWNAKLRDHYGYDGINDNWPWLIRYQRAAMKLAFRWLTRRSQNTSTSWENFYTYLERHPLAGPVKLKDLIAAM